MKRFLFFSLFLSFLLMAGPALSLNIEYFDNDYDDDGFVQSSNFEKYFGGNVRWGDSGGAAEWEYGIVPDPLTHTLVQSQFTWPEQGSHYFGFGYNPFASDPTMTAGLAVSLDSNINDDAIFDNVRSEITGDINSLAIRAKAVGDRTASLNSIYLLSLSGELLHPTALSLVGDDDGQYILFTGDELADGFVVFGEAALFASDRDGDRAAYQFKVGQVPVPEPATMLLLGIGLVGLAGIGRRRIKK